MYSVVIVGGGVSGASVAYHLYNIPNFDKKVLLIESGKIGEGVSQEYLVNGNNTYNASLGEEEKYMPWLSGSNVFDNPSRIKMIVTTFATTAKEFERHHGEKGLALYNKICSKGRDEQLKLANLYMNANLTNTDSLSSIQLGSVLIGSVGEEEELKEEYELFKKTGFEVEWWNKNLIESVHGSESNFTCGIYFPKDGIIDSKSYAKKLTEICKEKGLEVRENTTMENFIENNDSSITLILNNNEKITTKQLILTTGGFFLNNVLQGILRPCYSYLTGIKNNSTKDENKLSFKENIYTSHNTPNFFTYQFTHDWAMCKGVFRISGEDHFSALKCPRTHLRCKNMEDWSYFKYPKLKELSHNEKVSYIQGVYSETPDYIPLIGKVSEKSNVTYMVGCNAWGQAIYSGVSILIPGILGFRNLTNEEKEIADFLSIRRFRTVTMRPKF